MKRRDFIIRGGRVMVAAMVVGGSGLYFHNRKPGVPEKPLVKVNDFEVPADSNLPGITLAVNEDHCAALGYALAAIGGIRRFVAAGEKVTIKPNVGWDRTPEQAANTNPLLVGEMVRLCFEAGAREVIVSDVSCNDPRRCFLRSGIGQAAKQAGAIVLLPSTADFVQTNLQGKALTVWPVLRHFIDTDRLINMPIVKQHSLSGCTIGMKNLYGILGGMRRQLHQQIDQSIVDLASFCRPTLTVIDATRVLTRGGPQGGSLEDVEICNSVICATDQVAADARATEFLQLAADQVGHIRLAENVGLGKIDYRSLGYREIVG